MGSDKRYEYHRAAKKMGVPNIILTGVEKEVRVEFPDDDENMYACHVLMRLKQIAKEHKGDWSSCTFGDGDPPRGQGGNGKKDNACNILDY